jgi:hypothetical protein
VADSGLAAHLAVTLISGSKTIATRQETTDSATMWGLFPTDVSTNNTTSFGKESITAFQPDILEGDTVNPASKEVTMRGTQVRANHFIDESQTLRMLPAVSEDTAAAHTTRQRNSWWRGKESASVTTTITQQVMQPTMIQTGDASFGTAENPGGSVDAQSAVFKSGQTDVYKSVQRGVLELEGKMSVDSSQQGLKPIGHMSLPSLSQGFGRQAGLDRVSHVFEQATQAVGTVNAGLAVAQANNILGVLQVVGGQFGTITSSEGYSHQSGGSSVQVPNQFDWGQANFHGDLTPIHLDVQGDDVFDTLDV